MRLIILAMALSLSSCAVLHHVQLSDVDARPHQTSKIDIKISETGVNLQEAGEILRRLGNAKFRQQTDDATAIIGMFQMGPRTGNLVYNSEYARSLAEMIYDKCPSGKVSNLALVRETRKYPVVSGEIIKVSGDCWI